ncbi:hypothetical protein, partial [Companilactobacillus hulinensis]|uniref:hypothetical protein n=1 Tax=Companilactobacillus hulinensis TaxID=2486007 RepID=UPI001CDC1D57
LASDSDYYGSQWTFTTKLAPMPGALGPNSAKKRSEFSILNSAKTADFKSHPVLYGWKTTILHHYHSWSIIFDLRLVQYNYYFYQKSI